MSGHGYLIDDDGAYWPVTGYWCQGCGMPMRRIHTRQTHHPTCKPDQHQATPAPLREHRRSDDERHEQ